MDSGVMRKNRIVFVLIVIAAFIVLSFTLRDVNFLPFKVAHRVVSAVVFPFQAAFTTAANPIRETVSNLGDISTLRKDNEALTKQLLALQHTVALLQKAEDENIRLRGLMGEKGRQKFSTVPAQTVAVIGPWQSTIVINKGEDDGLKAKMPVLAAGGVAGQISEVFKSSATIKLINDSTNGVAAEVKRTGERGIVEGEVGGGIRLRFLPRAAKIKKGDVIITSGLGGVYPRGLLVGTVSGVKKQATLLEAGVNIQSAVHLGRVTDVLIVIGAK